jgi:hypothetical protein
MITRLSRRVAWVYGLVAEALPEQRLVIRRLIAADDAFRELCDEFAEAQVALSARPGPDSDGTTGTKTEWTEIVEHLKVEILNYVTERQARVP